ncbi:hypothetical protein L2243_24065, partial [Xanthomonas perforans]|nr:hypothetical protein [Xanthomonas perforans]
MLDAGKFGARHNRLKLLQHCVRKHHGRQPKWVHAAASVFEAVLPKAGLARLCTFRAPPAEALNLCVATPAAHRACSVY